MAGKTKILILGAGFGGVYAFKYLHERLHGESGVEMALVNRHNYFLFTPLLHEVATGLQTPVNVVEPLRTLCCLKNFYLTEVKKVNVGRSTVSTGCGEIAFDYLVIALGADTNFYDTPGAAEHGFTLKTLADAVKLKNHCIANFDLAAITGNKEKQRQLLQFVVVGGGATGVEVACELADFCCGTFRRFYPSALVREAKITLLQADEELLPQFSPSLRQIALQTLRKKGIDVRLGAQVTKVGKDQVEFAEQNGQEKILTNTTVWVAGIKPQALEFDKEAARDDGGRLVVQDTLQLPNHSNIFALGDVASFTSTRDKKSLPALAQVASKQAEGVARNICRLIKNKKPRLFKYQHSGDLISLGRHMAIGKIAGLTVHGRLTWCLWRLVYLTKMLSWKKRFRVAVDWTLNAFSPRDIAEL